MAKVAAIINARLLIPVSTDPSDPVRLTPVTLLTQKVRVPSAPPDNSGMKDILRNNSSTSPKPSGADGENITSHHYS